MTTICRWCGQPATAALYLNWREPRPAYEPLAVDPWYRHGGTPARTCGAAGCEAEAYAEVAAEHPGGVIRVDTEPGAGFVIADGEPGQ